MTEAVQYGLLATIGFGTCLFFGLAITAVIIASLTLAVKSRTKELYLSLRAQYEMKTLKTLADKLAAEGKIRSKP